jgi:hypothetical protein
LQRTVFARRLFLTVSHGFWSHSTQITEGSRNFHRPKKVSGVPPQACGFMSAVSQVREGAKQTRARCHHAARPMPIPPPITVTLTPGRLLVHPTQSRWDQPLGFWLRVPDRSQCLVHHRIAPDHLPRGTLEERCAIQLLELFHAGSRCFLRAHAIGFRQSVATAPAARITRSRSGRSSGACPGQLAPDT